MSYRKPTYLEQIWYIIKYMFTHRRSRIMIDKQCLYCGFYDPDLVCSCPSLDKWYACPLEPEPTPEDFMTEEELKNGKQ